VFSGEKRHLKILLFDDAVWRGRSLARVKRELTDAGRARGVELEIATAAFISHESAPADSLDIVYYRGLDDLSYDRCRSAIVDYLQFEGSLLLDTEHVEAEITVEGPLADFLSVVAGWGATVVFPSIAQRINCTTYQNGIRLKRQLADLLPPFASLEDSVCKIRVISKPDDTNRFTVIPICFPPIKLSENTEYVHPRMTWTRSVNDERRLFHCVGLCLSIGVLRAFITHVSSGLPGRIRFDYERGLGHLLPVFPEINMNELRSELDRVSAGIRSKHVRRGHIDDRGFTHIKQLAARILASCYARERPESEFLRKISLADIMEIAHSSGQPEARASAALDLLIDEARILPDISVDLCGDIRIATRVYGPDGEEVRRKVVREALLAGRGLEVAS